MSESFAMCSYNDCINKDNCVRYKDIPSPYYCLLNYKQICNNDNNYQWIVKKDESIEIKKKLVIEENSVVNVTENTETGENNINDIPQEEEKESESHA